MSSMVEYTFTFLTMYWKSAGYDTSTLFMVVDAIY